jgi:hypothetical protein
VTVALLLAATARDLSRGASRPTLGGSAADQLPSPTAPSQSRDPSASLLADLVVNDADVGGSQTVAGLAGGNGLTQPTLDLCNGTYGTEAQRTARLQVSAYDNQTNETVLSTEAVLYTSGAATTTAFQELKDTVAACPPAVAQFRAPPDAGWPQVPTVERLAFDFDTVNPAGGTSRSVAVYLRRGRALLGVYISRADSPTAVVQGKTAIADIVTIFAERLAKLPVSAISTTA